MKISPEEKQNVDLRYDCIYAAQSDTTFSTTTTTRNAHISLARRYYIEMIRHVAKYSLANDSSIPRCSAECREASSYCALLPAKSYKEYFACSAICGRMASQSIDTVVPSNNHFSILFKLSGTNPINATRIRHFIQHNRYDPACLYCISAHSQL